MQSGFDRAEVALPLRGAFPGQSFTFFRCSLMV
jgi:hypothetical protein